MRRTFSPASLVSSLLPPILWMGVIFFLSTNSGSAEHTNPLSDSLLFRFFPAFVKSLTAAQLDALHFGIRKAAHLTEYAVLGALLARAASRLFSPVSLRTLFFAWLVAALYASSDEFHQIFVAGRTPKVADVLIDSSGALVGILLWAGARKILTRKQQNDR